MNVNEFLKQTNETGRIAHTKIRYPVVCNDGYHVSCQASSFHYCNPRVDNADHYNSVELGFPTVVDNELAEYAEESNTTETVFGYVPVEVVDVVFEKHGGINEALIFNNK